MRAKNKPKLSQEQKAQLRELKKKHGLLINEEEASCVFVETAEGCQVFESEPIILHEQRTVGNQRRLVILYNFQNDPNNKPWTRAAINDIWNNKINQFYQTVSYGVSSLQAEIVDWQTIPVDNTDPVSPVMEIVKQGARDRGYDVDSYSDLVFIAPTGGIHTLSGTTAFSVSSDDRISTAIQLFGYGGSFDTSLHEYGHSLGFKHANSLSCGTIPLSDTCTHNEYGDTFDPMGRSSIAIANGGTANVGHREFARWLDPILITSTGIVALSPINGLTGIRSIKIPKTYTWAGNATPVNGFYQIEYRPSQGVFIRLMPDHTTFGNTVLEHYAGTHLLKPATNYFLTAGQRYVDSTIGLTLTVQSMGASGAAVNINIGEVVPDTDPPIVSIVSPVNGQILSGIVTGTAEVNEPATVEWYAVGSNWQVLLGTGLSLTQDTRQVPNGDYLIQVKARDTAGNFSWSQIVDVTVNNTTPPEPKPPRGKGRK